MSRSRLEIKVGLFVFIGLLLLSLLLLQFNKGASVFRPTYQIHLVTPNVGSLIPDAAVLMAGVRVGSVSDIRLGEAGTNVVITLKIFKAFAVRKDARFLIDQSGFLGDTYVAIDPMQNRGAPFVDGDQAIAQEPFNLQEVARAASGFIQRIDKTAGELNDSILDLRRLLLNEDTLTNLASTVRTLRTVSEQAVVTVGEINAVFVTNGPAIATSASNLALASADFGRFTETLNNVLATNTPGISTAVSNVEASSVILKSVLDDLHAGKGPAGMLLRDDQVAADLADIVHNLSVTTSNINRLGLWGVLRSRRAPAEHPDTNRPPQRLEAPKYSSP